MPSRKFNDLRFFVAVQEISDLCTFVVIQLMLGLTHYLRHNYFKDFVMFFFDNLDIIFVNFDNGVEILET